MIIRLSFLAILTVFLLHTTASVLTVGPSQTYARIDTAYKYAQAGDSILVYPLANDSAYQQVAIYLNKRRITISGQAAEGSRVKLSGQGFEYSGVGSIPRAIFQFNPGADSSLIEHFEVFACTNTSFNGAGFRNNQANNITVRDCEIRNNDMGIMANGLVADSSAKNFLIENCIVHDNGNFNHAGYNHNFYLGGTSVTLRGCNVYRPAPGHNVKSRAHITILEGCYIHDSGERECDLVDDAGTTAMPGSHAMLIGCTIVKDPACAGNKTVIHFGEDGGNGHNGTIYLIHCTIITPFISPVVDLSSLDAHAQFYNCLVADPSGNQNGQSLVSATRNGALTANSAGDHLWLSSGFSTPVDGNFANITKCASHEIPGFTDADTGDYSLTTAYAGIVDAGVVVTNGDLPASLQNLPLLTFTPPLGTRTRPIVGTPDIGACEWDTGTSVENGPLTFVAQRNKIEEVFIVDIRGKIIQTLAFTSASMAWDRTDHFGRAVGTGLYFMMWRDNGAMRLYKKIPVVR